MTVESRITYRGAVHPWQCDSMGHFSTRFYAAMFDDASLQFLHEIGHVIGEYDGSRLGWADVRHEIRYVKELLAGDLIFVESRPIKLGNTSLQYLHEMKHAHTFEVHGTMLAATVQFDLNARRAVPVIPAVRLSVSRWLESRLEASEERISSRE